MIIVLGFVINWSCSDVFVEDLEGKTVEIVSPQDSAVSDAATQLFIWKEMEDVLRYRIQIARPNFKNVKEFIDTTTTDLVFEIVLDEGDYEWKIRAENESTESDYTTGRRLFVEPTSDLSNFKPTLTSPVGSVQLTSYTVTFNWEGHPSATEYEIYIESTDKSWATNPPIEVIATDPPSHTFTIPSDGEVTKFDFTWNVKVKNPVSLPSNNGSFSIDTSRIN